MGLDLGQSFEDVKSWVGKQFNGNGNGSDNNIWGGLTDNMDVFKIVGGIISALIMLKMPGDIRMKGTMAAAVFGASIMLSNQFKKDFQRSSDPDGYEYEMVSPNLLHDGPQLEEPA